MMDGSIDTVEPEEGDFFEGVQRNDACAKRVTPHRADHLKQPIKSLRSLAAP
ncbi:hypothetical protein [Bradyrhizobium sp.]|uniref:hypothetical protein n=1 Tax=Bradyrhizobium sp. TaxID=376 RepID=UPI0025BFD452|nr:hypothetical protein [Bradyrhizobium sp.]